MRSRCATGRGQRWQIARWHGMEGFVVDDDWCGEGHPLALVLVPVQTHVRPVEVVRSSISFAREKLMHQTGCPFPVLAAVGQALAVQMIRDPPYALPAAAQSEHLLHDFRFDRVDFQLFLYGIGANATPFFSSERRCISSRVQGARLSRRLPRLPSGIRCPHPVSGA